MATISLDKQIKQYLPQLDSDEKQSILGVIKSFLKLKKTPQESHRISIEEYNKEGYDALERVKNGQSYTHEEVEEMSKEW